jgi:hypothetical protein
MTEITWEKDYAAARRRAEESSKLLLVDFFNPD